VISSGEPVKYCYVVTNPGTAPLYNVVVPDDDGTLVTLSGLSDLNGDLNLNDLPAGGSVTGSYQVTLTTTPGTSVVSIATAIGFIGVSDTLLTASDAVTVTTTIPQLTIIKTVTTANGDCSTASDSIVISPGRPVKYCYVVTNPGTAPLYNVVVPDDDGTLVTLSGLSDLNGDLNLNDLPAGGSVTGSYQVTLTTTPGTSVVSIATAIGFIGVSDTLLTASDAVTVTTTIPQLTIIKTVTTANGDCSTASDSIVISSGEPVKYCYVVTNPGTAPLYNVQAQPLCIMSWSLTTMGHLSRCRV
jgi:hypothetical protein